MDHVLDQLAASAPFPTIPAAAPTPATRPRAAKPRRLAAPFRSDHPAAASSSSPGRRTGGEFSSFALGAGDPGSRPGTGAGVAPAAFVFGGEAASSRGAEEKPASVSSWSYTRDAEFVFGSGVAGAPEVTRRSPLGSGDASLARILATVEEFSLDDSSGQQSDVISDAPRGNDSVLEMNTGDTDSFGAQRRSSNLHEHFCPMIYHAEVDQLNEGCGVPSQTTGCKSMETSSLTAPVVNSTICTEKDVPLEFTKDGGNSSVGDSMDKGYSAKDGSNLSTNAGVVGQNFFVFGEHTSVGERKFAANTAQNDIKNIDSSNTENVTYSSEEPDPSVFEGNTCTKVQPRDDSSNRDPPHLAPHKIPETEEASNTIFFKFESQNVNTNVSFTKFSDGMETECTAVATLGLDECGSFDEKYFTVHDHNAASREKGGVKGMNINRRAVKPKKFSSPRQISSLQTVFTSDCFDGTMSPEKNLRLKEIVDLPASFGLAQPEDPISQPSTALAVQRIEYAEPKTYRASRGLTCTKTENFGSQEDCETWRLRGNHAYDEGQLAKAEECYTYGINSVSLNEASQKALMLCYSNRAATRMSLGRMRDALSDCRKATDIDSNFLKAQVRAANCLLALGDVEEAKMGFEMCLKSNHLASLEQKIVEEASDGLQKVQKVFSFMLQSKEYLVKKAFDKIPSALQMISDALSISVYSDNLMKMKAEALLLLHRYEEVIQFCEETLHLAERNSVLCHQEHSKNMKMDNYTCSVKLWRYYLIAKSYFFIGKLEETHHFLKSYEQAALVECRCGKQYEQSVSSFSKTTSELLHLKAAGNEAFHAGKYSEAVDHYTAALLNNTESLHFSAVCFGNRAAAYQAMGQILDAIADCSLAIALDTSYSKAISRRASLYELIRDYDQAGNDLRRLISLLEKHLLENMSMPSEKSDSIHNNLNRAYLRLSALERDARKGASLNMHLILGIEPSCSAVDIKKAYRKAALKHHPDKAGNFLARSENISDASWNEITKKIRRDADYLFKIIGEAYAILSDSSKKSN